jgi:very-short-patch-repair endonuclease
MRSRFGRSVDFCFRETLAPRAREMRLAPTRSEARIWAVIRNGALGVRFRRQVVLGRFIVDFYAPSLKLVVEVDGGIHETQIVADARRDAWLASQGIAVVRVTVESVERELQLALRDLVLARRR